MKTNYDSTNLLLTTEFISVVKNMSAAPSRKRASPSTLCRSQVIRRRLNSDSESFSAGSYPNLHQMFHNYLEECRASSSIIPYHCPNATRIAKKIGIINKNTIYKPKCNNNCPVQKQCKKEAMVKHFHKCVKGKIQNVSNDELNKEFFVTSLDKIDDSNDNHFYPSCCLIRRNYRDGDDKKIVVTLQELAKCIHIKMKYR